MTRTWVVMNYYSHNAAFEAGEQIGFIISKLRSSLSDYCDVNLLVKRIIATAGGGADAAAERADEKIKQVTLKHFLAIH